MISAQDQANLIPSPRDRRFGAIYVNGAISFDLGEKALPQVVELGDHATIIQSGITRSSFPPLRA